MCLDNESTKCDGFPHQNSVDFEDEATTGIVTDTLQVPASTKSAEAGPLLVDSDVIHKDRVGDTILGAPRLFDGDIDSNVSSDDDHFHDAFEGSGPYIEGGDDPRFTNEAIQDTTAISIIASEAPNVNSPSELVDLIDGLYRILDLVSEEGSGGYGASYITLHGL